MGWWDLTDRSVEWCSMELEFGTYLEMFYLECSEIEQWWEWRDGVEVCGWGWKFCSQITEKKLRTSLLLCSCSKQAGSSLPIDWEYFSHEGNPSSFNVISFQVLGMTFHLRSPLSSSINCDFSDIITLMHSTQTCFSTWEGLPLSSHLIIMHKNEFNLQSCNKCLVETTPPSAKVIYIFILENARRISDFCKHI